jgi:transcriptional regulator with XRE-family HTH domain
MATVTPLKRSPHVLRWVRETLDLTQAEMASALGCAEPTVRAVESGRLKLSPKFAQRLSTLTGIHVGKLASNNLGNPLPDPTEVRRHFTQSQKALDFSPTGPIAEKLPLTLALRFLVVQGLIAEEIGAEQYFHVGISDMVQKTIAKTLFRVPNSKLRHRIFERSREMSDKEIRAYAEKALAALQESKATLKLLKKGV